MRKAKRLLWVDDHIAGFGAYVRALEADGFHVMTAASTPEALELARQHGFDIALIDIHMPPPDGIELLRQFHPIQPNAVMAALSSYLYLDKYREQLRSLKFAVELIDKDTPLVGAPDFEERFLRPIRNLVEAGVKNTVTSVEQAADRVEENPFEIPLVEFLRKSIIEKDRLALRAKQLAGPLIDRLFNEGKMWVLLCGGKDAVRASANDPNDVLSEDQVMEFARSQQRAPFQFWRPLDVEDIWTSCTPRADLRDYPTVTLQFDQGELTVHFDTGSPITFFSYEALVRLGAIRPTTQFGTASRNGNHYWTANLNVFVLLKSQGDGGARQVRLTGQAVRDWEQAPYVRRCDARCTVQPEGQVCAQRTALIGRNLLTENELTLILDGVQRQTRLGGSL